jgi:tRNA A37 methylthiotransferase MiaB
LIELIEAIESVDGVCSARILYLYPTTVSLKLIDKIYDSRVFQSYYDIPLQHIDDKMLKIMKRGFGEPKTRELLDYIASKGKDIFVRTSVIVGHPGEDEEAFWKLCNYIQEYGFDRVTVFAYSNEEDTTAFDMPQIDQEIIEKRVEIIGDIAKDIMYKSLDRCIGKDMVVAIDGVSSEHEYLLSSRPLLWASEIDGEVLINDKNDMDIEVGAFYTAHITQRADSYLMATLKQRIEC